jgi:hypothetical protein
VWSDKQTCKLFSHKAANIFPAAPKNVRSLTFITVRQKHYEPAFLIPFFFGCDNVLVNNNLRPPFEKSPNSASHITSAFGSTTDNRIQTENALIG